MLEIKGAIQKEYPEAIIEKCRRSTNQICRKEAAGGMLQAVEGKPTLLELAQPEMYVLYDDFEIKDFSFSKEEKKGHFKAEISLLKACKNLEIQAHILDLKSERVVAEVPVKQAENTNALVLEQAFTADKEQAENLGVIAYGKWGNMEPEENELTIFKEINTLYPGVTYVHKYPKKEKEAVVLGKLEETKPDKGAKGDADHIVIALIRYPDDTKDIDYICGAGRDKKNNHPIVCVPGEGTFRFPLGETPKLSEEYPNSAICKLYHKDGGAAVIAQSGNPAYETSNIKIFPLGNTYIYQFLAWGMGYDDPAGWKKTEFDYRLELTLSAEKTDGTWITREFVIDTRDPDISITDEVLTLEIMYGCMAPETEITMADGSKKQICRMKIGDMVAGKGGVDMLVENIWRGPETDMMLELWAEGLQQGILVTKNHPVWIQEADGTVRWKRASACSVGDKVLVWHSHGEEVYHSIIEIIEKEPCEEVYNLDLQPQNDRKGQAGTMYCNGILTGDNRMQNSDLEG